MVAAVVTLPAADVPVPARHYAALLALLVICRLWVAAGTAPDTLRWAVAAVDREEE